MSGIGRNAEVFGPTGNSIIDSILSGFRWADTDLTYSFPTASAEYGDSSVYGDITGLGAFPETFSPVSLFQQQIITRILDSDSDVLPSASASFSVDGFTLLNFSETTDAEAHIRAANTETAITAFGYFPGEMVQSGDIWFGDRDVDLQSPIQGNFAFFSPLQEIGHALGLDHPDAGETAALSFYDQIQFSVMSNRSYEGGPLGYQSEEFGFPQSFMMVDISALQALYGADFSVNSEDTTYTWNPDTGSSSVSDNIGGPRIFRFPGENRIFETIWDGGGNDTFLLTNYETNLSIDLNPGGYSRFSEDQLADLGDGNFALGNVYNAFLYENDTRSLIENVTAGTGDDTIVGNQVANRLIGNRGDDNLSGLEGDDFLHGGDGNDELSGDEGNDELFGGGATISSEVVRVLM